MQRTKSRSQLVGRSAGYYAKKSGVGNSLYLTIGGFHDALYERWNTEQITYGVGQRFNPCTHSGGVSSQYAPASSAELTNSTWYAKAGSYTLRSVPVLEPYGNSEPHGLQPKGSVVQSNVSLAERENARIDGYNRLIHQPPQRHMNVLRSVMELKDTEQTLSPLVNFMKWMQEMNGRSVRLGRVFKPISTGMKLSAAASAYLWYRFGVEPTVSDVNQFRKELESGRLSVRGHKPRLIPRNSVLVGRYSVRPSREEVLSLMFPNARGGSFSYERELECSRNGGYVSVVPNGISDPFLCRFVRVAGATRGCYFARTKEDIEISGLSSLRRSFGWSCPALKTLWDLLPFSFLVDWVIDVGGAIERLEKRYLMESFEKSLGPIWHAERTETILYAPGIATFKCRMLGTQPPAHPYTGGRFKIMAEGNLSYWVKERSFSFYREKLSEAPALVSPVWTARVNAYRITTGMALLAQLAKSWR